MPVPYKRQGRFLRKIKKNIICPGIGKVIVNTQDFNILFMYFSHAPE